MKLAFALLLTGIVFGSALPDAHALQARRISQVVVNFGAGDTSIRVKYTNGSLPAMGSADFSVASVMVRADVYVGATLVQSLQQIASGPSGRLAVCGSPLSTPGALCFRQINVGRGSDGDLQGELVLNGVVTAPAGATVRVTLQANAIPGTGLKKPGTEVDVGPALVQTVPNAAVLQ